MTVVQPSREILTNSNNLPRLLIAEKNISTVEFLIHAFTDKRLNVDFDVCGSNHSAVGMLLAFPYQLIVSNVHLAEMDDLLLLKRTPDHPVGLVAKQVKETHRSQRSGVGQIPSTLGHLPTLHQPDGVGRSI